jgi:hypothetical protein
LRPDGATEALDVVVGGGVLVEGFDLLELIADRVVAFTVEVGGVTYRAAERRGADAGPSHGADAPRPAEPPGNAGSPGPPGFPGDPGSARRRDPGRLGAPVAPEGRARGAPADDPRGGRGLHPAPAGR